MRYIVPNDDKVRTIPLGRAGEKNYTEIALDISAWQNEFSTIDSVAILMQGRNDATAYIGDVVIDGKYAVHTHELILLRISLIARYGTARAVITLRESRINPSILMM